MSDVDATALHSDRRGYAESGDSFLEAKVRKDVERGGIIYVRRAHLSTFGFNEHNVSVSIPGNISSRLSTR